MCPTQRNIANGFIEATTMRTLDGVPALGFLACRSGMDPPSDHMPPITQLSVLWRLQAWAARTVRLCLIIAVMQLPAPFLFWLVMGR
jgi:hypothetical protein